jgi:tRNA-specific adenosine deaminase 3
LQCLCNIHIPDEKRYDLFTTKEPSIFEAMALVHSRIRRVIFGSSNKLDGGLGGTGLDHAIHSLPGTNHHYRAFQCNPILEDDLHALCEDLQTC